MQHEPTPAVVRALAAAQRLAGLRNALFVENLDLLLGLIDEEEGQAATLLLRAGLDLVQLRRELEGDGREDRLEVTNQNLPFTPSCQEVLEHAHEVIGAQSMEGTLSSEQVLIVLLERDEPLRQRLECFGLSWQILRGLVMVVLDTGDEALSIELDLQLDPTERIDTARILDASANRAREALRVVEDYCRFVLDDVFLCREMKQMRHDLVATLNDLGPDRDTSLAARETLRDVGTSLSTPSEQHRGDLLAVVAANVKRWQEALRSLEEFGKLRSPAMGQAFEALRYRSYTLERAILLGASARQRLVNARLYVLVSSASCTASLDWTIQEAAAGGAQIFQLREKNLSDCLLLERARLVRAETRKAGALFVMNDRSDLARLVEADGVHLGQDDLPVKEARRILGAEAFIGVSTHNLDQVRQAVLDGASYIGVGPTFQSGTKSFAELSGLELVRQAMAETSLPAFAIGGVNLANLAEVMRSGAHRVAVCQAICQADDPRQAAVAMRRMLGAGEDAVTS